MLPHNRRRPDSAAGDQFSFFSPTSDHLEYNTWAENLKTLNNSFGKRNPNPQFGPWVRTIRSASAETSSPPLWKSASPESLPNTSRAQMIDRYRQEMMDLARDLPETAYELSLRDMVELNPSRRKEEDEEEESALTERWGARRKGRGKRWGSSNGIMDSGGFLLKLFMPSVPAAIGGGGRKISPRPMAAASDGEWSSGGFRERSSSNGSSGSSCSGGGRQRWKFGGCYSFFYRHRRSRSN